MDYAKESLRLHEELKGKLEVVARTPVDSKEALSLAYTPGVAQPCLEIQKDINKSYELTRRWNTVAVVSDGSAVLGLGDIGPEASMPVMEGKCVLFKEFGDVDAIPLCIRSKEVDDIVDTVALLAGSFGGVNLEDISAPRCFEIEKKLKERCDIPIFHDDQHGTAVVVAAALINALKLAQIWDYVSTLEHGLDTVLGEKGLGLSEGQVQRISIARALLYDAPILLLDEATSALDEHTETELLKTLKTMTDKTCIIISHKKAAFDFCDKVINYSDIN